MLKYSVFFSSFSWNNTDALFLKDKNFTHYTWRCWKTPFIHSCQTPSWISDLWTLSCTISALTWGKKPIKMHATCNPKVITALTEDYKALMLRRLMGQSMTWIPVVPCSTGPFALTELGVTGHDWYTKGKHLGLAKFVKKWISFESFIPELSIGTDFLNGL